MPANRSDIERLVRTVGRPGVETSEFEVASRSANASVLVIALGAISTIVPQFLPMLPSPWFEIGGFVVIVAGVVLRSMVAAGYIRARSAVKSDGARLISEVARKDSAAEPAGPADGDRPS